MTIGSKKFGILDQTVGLRAAPVAVAPPPDAPHIDFDREKIPAWRHLEPDPQSMEARVIETLKGIYDPEIPVNVFDLGLIYSVEADDAGFVRVVMTLTSPMCPVADAMPAEIEEKVGFVAGVVESKVELTWEPPWNKGMMGDEAKLELNMF